MAHVQRTGYVTDEEAYETWNMGQGMVIATPDERSVIKVAQQHGIEAKKIGKVTSAPGIAIVSGGAESYQKTLHFNID